MGLAKFAVKTTWKTGKFAVRRIVVPLVYTAAWAAALSYVSDKLREGKPQPNGRVEPTIKASK